MIISATCSLREALSTAEKYSVDPKAVVDMLTQTLFPAPIYLSSGQRIVEKIKPSQSEIPLKDLHLLKMTAQQAESSTAISNVLYDLLRNDV